MPAGRSLRTKKTIKYMTETDEDGNEIISSDIENNDTKPSDKDPDFAAGLADEAEEESDKENIAITPVTSKKRKTSKLDDSDEDEASGKRLNLDKSDDEDAAPLADTSAVESSLARDLEELRNRSKASKAERDADFGRLLNEVDSVRESPIVQPKKRTSKKSNKIDGFTVEQWRRQLGNAAKATISFTKWTIAARTHFTHSFTSEAFRALIVPLADEYHPKDFNSKTPVIMASSHSNSSAGQIMGSSKLTGGSRYGTFSANKADYIYIAEKKELRVWFTMSGY